MGELVVAPIAGAVSSVADAVGSIATSDTPSANNLSLAIKDYVSGVAVLPKTAADVIKSITDIYVAQGGVLSDNVNKAIAQVGHDVYFSFLKHPDNIKVVGDQFVNALGGLSGKVRESMVNNIAATAVMPLEIAKSIGQRTKKIIFGGSMSKTDFCWIIVIIVTIIVVYMMYKASKDITGESYAVTPRTVVLPGVNH